MIPSNEWEGKRVRLRGIEPSDWEVQYKWNKDSEMTRNVDCVWFPSSKTGIQKWAAEADLKETAPDKKTLIIETLDGVHVGLISTDKCDQRNGTFTYGIAIRREHQQQGYASDAMRILFRQFFNERRYHKVVAHVFAFNEGSIQLHERFGMQLEGRLREMIYTNGQHFDELIYGMTAAEFFEKYPMDCL